jgi:hypothetical protein
MSEPKNEKAVCDGTLCFLEKRCAEEIKPVGQSDQTDRQFVCQSAAHSRSRRDVDREGRRHPRATERAHVATPA